MTRAAAARSSRAPSTPKPKLAKGYFHRSETPLTSLVFLLPFLIIYDVGMLYLPSDIVAYTWVQEFFQFFGVYGRHLPALSVAMILLAWHIASKAPWHVSPRDLSGMFLECLVLTIPLLLMTRVAAHYLPMLAVKQFLPGMFVLSVGAGIYEELVFRLGAFTVLTILLVDLMKMPRRWAYPLMVVVSALAFSLYHYLGYETFQWHTFAFRTAAGIYFGVVFAFRGFGISAGSHAAYDVIVSVIRTMG